MKIVYKLFDADLVHCCGAELMAYRCIGSRRGRKRGTAVEFGGAELNELTIRNDVNC